MTQPKDTSERRVALITGATSGIGLASARALGRPGSRCSSARAAPSPWSSR